MYGLTSNSNLGVAGFNSLNGLATSGYGGNYGGFSTGFYGYGGTGVEDATAAKEQMQNSYSIYATQQGLNNKQQAETMAYNQQSQNVASLLKVNRNDDAVQEFEKMVQNIKATPQYSTYSDAEIRAIAQAQYQNATGTNLVNDINQKASSSFVQGLKMGVPIFGWFGSSGKSREDMVAQVTGTKTSVGDTTQKVFGATLSSAAAGAGGYALVKGVGALKSSGVLSTATKGLPTGVSTVLSSLKGKGWVAAAVAGGAALIGLGIVAAKNLFSDKAAA